MTDAPRIEAVKAGTLRSCGGIASGTAAQADSCVAPMDQSTVKVSKATPAERQQCMREGLCLRCREKGHPAKNFRKDQLN